MKHFARHIDLATLEKASNAAVEIEGQKKIIEASKAHASYVNAINDLTDAVIGVQKTPKALIAMDSLCTIFEREFFAQNEKERDKCNQQLRENMDAINALNAVRNPAQYRQTLAESGVDKLTEPTKDGFIALLDKRTQQLGRDSNNINTPTEKKKLYEARKANLSLAKSLYKELQREAMNLNLGEKEKTPGKGLFAPKKGRGGKEDEQESDKILAEALQAERDHKALTETVGRYDAAFKIYETAQAGKLDKIESNLNNAIQKQQQSLKANNDKKPGFLSTPATKKTWEAKKVKIQKNIRRLENKRLQVQDARANLHESFRKINPTLAKDRDIAARRLREFDHEKKEELKRQQEHKKTQTQSRGRSRGLTR